MSSIPRNTGLNANELANSLGVSPLYKQHDDHRWQTAAHVYNSSRAHSPIPNQIAAPIMSNQEELCFLNKEQKNTLILRSHLEYQRAKSASQQQSESTPFSLEEIADANRKTHSKFGSVKNVADHEGPLELEAIAAVHELANLVESVSVSEMLPKTPSLIFLIIKTVEDDSYTLELTMKGWRVASKHTDSMNGDYNQMELHTRYFHNAKELVEFISPGCKNHFNQTLAKRLSSLKEMEVREGSMLSGDSSASNTIQYLPRPAFSLRSVSAPDGDTGESNKPIANEKLSIISDYIFEMQ
uniref:DUF727 domain-containing protein n=1 Tax=Rhabditophanes sp. KR3021 TaxID=114890 RepID=A0AC35U627_9BILA